MSDVKRALTRKFGPLPAWAWALVAAVGLYYYRSRSSSSTAAAAQAATSTPTVSDQTGGTPQAPIPLDPGQSVYDPNSGSLISAPDTSGSTGNQDALNAINGLTDALNNATNTGDPVTGVTPVTSAIHTGGAAGVAHAQGHSSRFQGPGKYIGGKLGFSPRKAGIKAVGHSASYSGSGDYKRVVKAKPGSKNTTKPAKPSPKKRAPATTKKTVVRARMASVAAGSMRNRAILPGAAKPASRDRTTTPVIRNEPTVQQRPVATHPVARTEPVKTSPRSARKPVARQPARKRTR